MFTSDKRLQDQYIPDRNSASATFHIVIFLIMWLTNLTVCLSYVVLYQVAYVQFYTHINTPNN
jgi:hypothetical protein